MNYAAMNPGYNAKLFATSKQRFSNRVADYVRYRPGYPDGLLNILRIECNLLPQDKIADIGSGTGLLSEPFLKNGSELFGVEPNAEMRAAGEEFLKSFPNFHSVAGSAEATTLPDSSVRFVLAGQAFHWFEPVATRREFARILQPAGWVVIVWNERRKDSEFARAYEEMLLRYGTDYASVRESYPQREQAQNFFGHSRFLERSLPNAQDFDLDGHIGRLRSSSFAPTPEHPNYVPIMAELKNLFFKHSHDGRLPMEYSTHIYFGQLDSRPDPNSSAEKVL